MGEKYKILIVDDERSHILALNDILKPMYSTFAAKDGQTALNIVKENTPDLILLDVVMPGMTGFEVLTELKKSKGTSRIPVIPVTGLDDPEDEEKAFELGAADYITKPFRASIIKARIKMQLQMLDYIRHIETLGLIDPLTKLQNRRSFDNQMSLEWHRATREKEMISIMMMDIDHFKNYNDTYGHMQGDKLLLVIADIFTKMTRRATDMVARWGGEEFIVLLPNTDLSGALNIAENIRNKVENALILCNDGTPTRCTISIGVNAEVPDSAGTIDDFILKADKALYAAKGSGRNRVCSY